ncbi:MAG: RimK family alpha-L-glutamate ligase [Gammaproteobacteria bacterium]|nr:RimK family alpha-L-glutamate ligase [Gammaproteobacteria bacterium]
MTRVAIVTDDPGWHGSQLSMAFKRRGVDSCFTSLSKARIRLESEPTVELQGFERHLPDAVFVRGVPGGTLEQVVFHLNVLHALRSLGVPVYNDGRAIERSVDKSLTTLRLRQAGLPSPATWVCTDHESAAEIVSMVAARGHKLLCKPLFGSQGNGIVRVATPDDLPAADLAAHVWYLQQFIGDGADGASDWRVFVVGGHAIAAMRRTAPGWLANVAQGGRCHPAVADGELAQLAEAATRCLDMAYAGVDLMRDDDGRWWLIEVNSIPAWKGLQAVCQIDIAGRLVDDLLSICQSPHSDRAAS